jgi:urease accessory protein
MNGALELRIAVEGTETRVIDSYAHAPFHYLPPVHRAGRSPLLTVVNSSGGVLGGDVLDMTMDLGPGTRLTLRQQAATKVYRSGGQRARSTCRFTLGEGALLDYFPDEIIPFAGSDFSQTTEIELAAGAGSRAASASPSAVSPSTSVASAAARSCCAIGASSAPRSKSSTTRRFWATQPSGARSTY